MHRLGFEHRKPEAVSANASVAKQADFIASDERRQNSLASDEASVFILASDEASVFIDAVHSTRIARPVGCWMSRGEKIGVDQSSGRKRFNIHGAIDLETGQTRMIDALTIDATTTLALLNTIERMHAGKRRIHVYMDNARYHHVKIVREWLAQPERRVVAHFIPSYYPHLNPIERLWGLMHRKLTHNRCDPSFRDFADTILGFLRKTVPKNGASWCDHVSDNFRVVDPNQTRFLA